MNTTASHPKSSTRICLTLVLVSLVLVVTDVKVVPGGPFVSVHGEIVPVLCCMAVLFLVARDFRVATTARRVGLSFLAVGSAGIIALVIQIVVSFCHDRFARGTLVGW